MDMRLRSGAVWFRPMRCRPESLWDCVFKGYPITAIGQSGVPDFGHCSYFNSCKSSRVRCHTKGAEALGRSEKPNEIKIRPGNTTLSHLKRTIRRRRTSESMVVAFVVVLTLTRTIKSVVTGQAPVTLESGVGEYPRKQNTRKKEGGTRIQVCQHLRLFVSFSHTFTFQLLDKPWSQVLSLLPPGSFLFYRA